VFERFTEKARRIIFFARYEASQSGSDHIEPGHLLLGLLREDRDLASAAANLVPEDDTELRRQLTRPGATKISVSVDLPLSHSSQRVLAYAAEESEKLGSKHIDTVHVLMGLVREEDPIVSPLLKSRGVTLEILREHAMTPAAEKRAERRTAMEMLHRTLERMGRGAGAFNREGDRANGRFSASTIEDGTRVVESHTFIQGHAIRVVERMKVSEDGKTLRYSVEVKGPGQEHRHEIDFPLE
jgi:ATP-dependent Clp protease ATP-binding subunit ClpA